MDETGGFVVPLKFGEKAHLEALRNHGLIYAKHIRAFANERVDLTRNDRYEGTEQILQPRDLSSLIIKDNKSAKEFNIPGSHFTGPLRFSLGKTPYCNIFSMFGLTEPSDLQPIDSRLLRFGDSFIIVLDTQEFLNRILTAAWKAKLHVEWKFIDYFEERTFSGETGPFRKPSSLSWQREFRLAFQPASIDPLQLIVGDLSDITTRVISTTEPIVVRRIDL